MNVAPSVQALPPGPGDPGPTSAPAANERSVLWEWLVDQIKLPDKIKPSEWAEAHRVMAREYASIPGKFSLRPTPYLREIIDTYIEPGVEVIVLKMASRLGKNEAVQSILGYSIDQDPCQWLWVREGEAEVSREFSKKLRLVIERTPALARHVVNPRRWINIKEMVLSLDKMDIQGGYSGSSGKLASSEIRNVMCDEVNKWAMQTRDEKADPIMQAYRRTQNQPHRKIYITCTPTYPRGRVTIEFDKCLDRRFWFGQCPHCGEWTHWEHQHMEWPRRPREVSRIAWAEKIYAEGMAWLRCPHCAPARPAAGDGDDEAAATAPPDPVIPSERGIIDEAARREMMAGGQWVPAGVGIGRDGSWIGSPPRSSRRGYHGNRLMTLLPGASIATVARDYLMAKEEGKAALVEYWNQVMGKESTVHVRKVAAHHLEKKLSGVPPSVCPSYTKVIYASMDTQKDGIYYLLRAFGYEQRSALILAGYIDSRDCEARGVLDWDELLKILTTKYEVQGGGQLMVKLAGIDTGGFAGLRRVGGEVASGRTHEVYEFTRKNRFVLPLKGQQTLAGDRPFAQGSIYPKNDALARLYSQPLYHVNVTYYADMLAGFLEEGMDPEAGAEAGGAESKWQLSGEVPAWYIDQLTAEEKDEETGVWDLKKEGLANHILDCERYVLCVADLDPFKVWRRDKDGNLFARVGQSAPPKQAETADRSSRRGSAGHRRYRR